MIKVKIQDAKTAYVAFTEIGQIALPPKAAYRVARLISKLRGPVSSFEETQHKLYLEAGGVLSGNSISVKAPERLDDESPEEFQQREAEHIAKVQQLRQGMKELLDEEVEIDYDPIPLSLFDNDSPERAAKLKPVDLANAGPFIKE